MNPASRSAARDCGVTESGLASVVTSAPSARPNSSRTASSSLARSAAATRSGCRHRRRRWPTGRSGHRGLAGPAGSPRPLARRRSPGTLPSELGRRVGVEVAVAATGRAVGHVQVETRRAGAPSVSVADAGRRRRWGPGRPAAGWTASRPQTASERVRSPQRDTGTDATDTASTIARGRPTRRARTRSAARSSAAGRSRGTRPCSC